MAEVLSQVAREGLPGKHHFFITFDTTHPGVDMAASLKARYPKEMTIVLQEWFADLAVMKDRFSVTLNFGDVPEPIVVPFEAVKTFVDPSVEFGLRFDAHEEARPAASERRARAGAERAAAAQAGRGRGRQPRQVPQALTLDLTETRRGRYHPELRAGRPSAAPSPPRPRTRRAPAPAPAVGRGWSAADSRAPAPVSRLKPKRR